MDTSVKIPSSEELADLENLAVDVARRCGRLIIDERPRGLGVADTKSSATDVVTVMDKRCEQLASDLLHQARPADGQFGEEGLAVPGTSGITWVVDPIDGTVNYLYEVPAYCVSVAAVVGDPSRPGAWRPVAGAVYNPVSDELWSAHHHGGARRLRRGVETTLTSSPADCLAMSLVATGFSYSAEVRAEQGEVVSRLLPQVRDIRRMGSAALDLCRVAETSVDVYYERMLNPWDMAAGWIIASEAGLEVRGIDGAAPDNRLTMSGRPDVLDALARIISPPLH